FGDLPEWRLEDLYPAMDSAELKADLARAEEESIAFEKAYQGRIGAIATGAGARARLAEAVRAFEALEERLGRIASYAGLVHASDTTDPKRAKFYGDVQEKVTNASARLIFFSLEMNRVEDEALEKAMADPALGHYRPWIED